jgi:hypothetical protein
MADDSLRFTVNTPPELLSRLRDWSQAMSAVGRRKYYVAALKEMNERLEQTPALWGDPLKEYEHIHAFEIRGMIPGWFLVWYGVDTQARIVIVRDIQPAPGSPLHTQS